jgi:hypothetical protein
MRVVLRGALDCPWAVSMHAGGAQGRASLPLGCEHACGWCSGGAHRVVAGLLHDAGQEAGGLVRGQLPVRRVYRLQQRPAQLQHLPPGQMPFSQGITQASPNTDPSSALHSSSTYKYTALSAQD